MAGSSFLTLLDDVVAAAKVAAASADDVAVMTVTSTKKAGGIVVDDMAVTAGGMVGIDASRELPIVWAVAKGSLFNKCVLLIPAALLLSWLAPWVITPILMLGGAFLCFEAVEKILHHEPSSDEPHVMPKDADPVLLEKEKIQGAIKTDVILSAEIVALTMAGLESDVFLSRALVLYGVGLLMTIGVYGMVALLVKLDDVGVHLAKEPGWKRGLGRGILAAAPTVFKVISVVGTAAMLIVGGGIIVHGFHADQVLAPVLAALAGVPGVTSLVELVFSALVGGLTGVACIPVAKGLARASRWVKAKRGK